jgi:hypothetical protein
MRCHQIARRRSGATERVGDVEDLDGDIGEDFGEDAGADIAGDTVGDLGAEGSSISRALSTGSHSSTSSAALPKR